MTTLSKQSILAASDTEIRIVDVPAWGGQVGVRVMSGAQRDHFEDALVSRRGADGSMNTAGLRALLVSLTACDENGTPIFDEADIPELEKKSARALQLVFDAASDLNGLSSAAAEEARADFTADRS